MDKDSNMKTTSTKGPNKSQANNFYSFRFVFYYFFILFAFEVSYTSIFIGKAMLWI